MILLYLSTQEEAESERLAFYLNFIYGDDLKVETYSDRIWPITDEYSQKAILNAIDSHLPDLKQPIIDKIKAKLIESQRKPPSQGSNISETIQKLKWMYIKGNYIEFYESVTELARIFLLNDQLIKAETLYKELKEELDRCEDFDSEFKNNGFYRLLMQERKKHMDLVIIMKEVNVYNFTSNQIQNNLVPEDGSKVDVNNKRRKRIIKKIDGILRNPKSNTVNSFIAHSTVFLLVS